MKLQENKNLTAREISFGKKVIDYTIENPTFIDEIKSLSKIKEKEITEIKFVYDKLLLLSKEDWKRIIDFATQTNTFSNLELANLKSVQSALFKREKIKEQALLKTYESVQKLKKFGIKV